MKAKQEERTIENKVHWIESQKERTMENKLHWIESQKERTIENKLHWIESQKERTIENKLRLIESQKERKIENKLHWLESQKERTIEGQKDKQIEINEKEAVVGPFFKKSSIDRSIEEKNRSVFRKRKIENKLHWIEESKMEILVLRNKRGYFNDAQISRIQTRARRL